MHWQFGGFFSRWLCRFYRLVGRHTDRHCMRRGGGGVRCSVGGRGRAGSFLSSNGLRYGPRRDHVQQVLSLPISQAGCFVPPHTSRVQVSNVHPGDVVELAPAVVGTHTKKMKTAPFCSARRRDCSTVAPARGTEAHFHGGYFTLRWMSLSTL